MKTLSLFKNIFKKIVLTKREYYSFGKIKSKTEYLNGLKHGLEKKYSELGKLIIESNWKHGIKHGRERIYYGQSLSLTKKHLAVECFFIDGLLDGVYKSWDFFGPIELEALYKKGKLQGCMKKYNMRGDVQSYITSYDFLNQTEFYKVFDKNFKLKAIKTVTGVLLNGIEIEF